MSFHKTGRPLVWAHRGGSGCAPENTLASFKYAVESGADGVELDVQMTKDKKIVVIHDETVNRTGEGKGWVKDYTFDELRRINFNKKFPEYGVCRIPLLSEVFELLYPTRLTVNVELKTGIIFYEGLEEKVVELVREMDMKDRVLYSSFNHYSLEKLRALDPDAYLGFLYADGHIGMPAYCKAHGGNALHPALYNIQYPGFMKEAAENGLDVNVWTVNERSHIEMCAKAGVNAIISDYPGRVLDIVGRMA